MQLLRGCPRCHLNSALPPLFSIHLSACVPKHFCLMTSSLWFSQFRPLIDPLSFYQHYYVQCWLCSVLCYNGMRDWESTSEQWVCCLLVSTAILASFSPRRAPHGQCTHMERTSSYSILTTSASETSAWLSVCVFVSVRVFVGSLWMLLSEVSRESTGAEWPNTRYTLFLSRPGQGKTC